MRAFVKFFIVTMIAMGCVKEGEKDVELKVGDGVPEFEVVMSDGSVVGDDDLRGRVSVVMFFHTGCPDCRAALPVVQRVYDEYVPKGVVFALVSREEGREEVEVYWEEKGLKMPYSAQDDRSVYEKFAVIGIPRIFVNDRDGVIRYVFTDNPVPEYSDLKSALDSLL